VVTEPLDGGARYRVTFRYQPVIAVGRVALAGSFNGWSKTKDLLRDPDGDGTYELSKVLSRGHHEYKFVIDGDNWQHDPDHPRKTADGHSGFNSILELGSEAPTAPGRHGDGVVMEQLIHDPSDLAMACAVDGRRRLVLRLHALAGDVQEVQVLATPRPLGSDGGRVVARRIGTWEGRDVYEARLLFARPIGKVRYAFELTDGAQAARLPAGRQRFSVSGARAGRFETPEWARDAVFYQIFPDRFRDGSADLTPALPRRPAGAPWRLDDRYLDAWGSRPGHFNFMGGDLPGITERLDYLASLGITAIYLNPIFKAGSNHRYDASDYELVDPALGTIDDFRALEVAAEERGIRLLLDCVFNHTGDTHYAFQDVMKNGAKSRYRDWYFFDGGFPVVQSPKPNYRCWWGFGSLPQLNTRNPEVVDHLMNAGKRWLEEGASGWRLDVPNELDEVNPEFWPEFRRQVRKVDPEAYIVGEIWNDARKWLGGDKFDAVMNYPVRSAALEFIAKGSIDGRAFAEALSQQLCIYPEPALRVQFNLLGSHDTARIKTLAGGDARRVRLALSFLFAWQGPPVVYYGDEVGLDGGKDPDCRKAFPWESERQDAVTLDHVRRLGAARKAERALRRGEVRFLRAEGKLCAFVREPAQGDAGRPLVCVLNASDQPTTARIPLTGLEGSVEEVLGGRDVRREQGDLVVELGPFEAAYVAVGGDMGRSEEGPDAGQ
jgi:glycosidase